MKAEKIIVLFFKVGEFPKPKVVPNMLEAMQELVHGNIETVTLEDGLVLICNEEGFLKGLPLNANVVTPHGRQNIRGDFFLCGTQGDQFVSLHNVQEMYEAMDLIVWRYK